MGNETLVEAYLDGTLSPQEVKEFEGRLLRDAELQHELKLQRDTRGLLALNRGPVLKKQLQEIEAAHHKQIRPLWQNWYAVAAVVIVLIGIGALLWQGTLHNPYESAFEAYPDRITMRQANSDSLVNQAMSAYRKGNFDQAIPSLSQLKEMEPDQVTYQFYLGVAQLGAGLAGDAISTLEPLRSHNLFGEAATWYLALAYGQSGDEAKAQELLQVLTTSQDSPYRDAALELLD